MNPQERQMVDDLFDRLAKLETAPRDGDAESAIMAGLRRAPNAVYALVQTVLVQDEALRRANAHIEELEGRAGAQNQSGGFLDSMRSAFGLDQGQPQGQSRSSVPNVSPANTGRPVWNSGQVLGNNAATGSYADPRANPPYGDPRGGMFGGPQPAGGGSSFLGTAAAAAAGVIGGSLLMNSIRGLGGGFGGGIGGNQQSFASDNGRLNPWGSDSSDSNSSLARDVGINDVGKNTTGDDGQRQNSFDQTQADAAQDAEQDRYDDDDNNYASGDFDGPDFDGGGFGSDDSGFA